MGAELAELRAEVRRLADRDEIRDVFARFAAAMDVQDWALLEGVFAPEIVFDHSRQTWSGPVEEVWTGREHVLREMRGGVSRHVVANHVITNERITLDGDRARAAAYLHSIHLDDADHAEEHADHGAWYLAELVRTADGWRFSRLRHIALWRDGLMKPDGPVTPADIAAMREHLR